MGSAARARSLRLAYALELVLTFGVGLGMARAQYTDPQARARLAIQPVSARLRQLGGTMLTGMAITGALGLAIELARDLSPLPWGIGRATWALTGIFAVLNSVSGVLFAIVSVVVRSGHLPGGALLSNVTRLYWGQQMLLEFAWALAAFWLAAWIARWPIGGPHDAREWTGRGFGVLVLGASIAIRVLQTMNM